MSRLGPWEADGWRGRATEEVQPVAAAILRLAEDPGGRRSRHAWTTSLETPTSRLFVKVYPPAGARRAWRAFRMGEALRGSGFGAPEPMLIANRRGAGLLVTRDVGGAPLEHVADLPRAAKWAALRGLGGAVAALHRAGFVHGDLVPSNVRLCGDTFVWLDNDRTQRGRLLVWWGGRRNLVQLGRFVIPGVSTTDRARVLRAYTGARGVGRAGRHRLARWVARKTIDRRSRIDHLDPAAAVRAGFREVMRSGGPFDLPHRSVP